MVYLADRVAMQGERKGDKQLVVCIMLFLYLIYTNIGI